MAPNLIAPVILGLPLLSHNSIVVDHTTHTVMNKQQKSDLMNPSAYSPPTIPPKKLRDVFNEIKQDHALMVAECKMVCTQQKVLMQNKFEHVHPFDVIATVCI